MNSNVNNNNGDFKSPDDAFEYLVNKRLDERRKKEWTKAFDEKQKEIAKANKKSTKRLYLRIASVAACFLAVMGAVWMMNMDSSNGNLLAQNYIEQTKVNLNYEDQSRALEATTESGALPGVVQDKLSAALKNQDYGQMLGIYRTYEKKLELPTRDKYYFAISLLKSEKEDKFKAIRLLDEVISKNDNLEIEALYFRGLAKIAIDNPLEGKEDLELVMTKSNYKKNSILQLIKEIK